MTDQRKSRAVNSRAFANALDMAEKYAGDALRISNLLNRANSKASKNEGTLRSVWDYLRAMQRLLWANLRREYTAVPWRSLVLITAAIFYLVSPLDFIPDFIPLGGLLDDVTIIAYVIGQVHSELEQFLAWEQANGVVIEGETVEPPS